METKPSCASPASASADPSTSYIQADPDTFRRVVQQLTGASPKQSATAGGCGIGPRRQAFKLRDRRGSSVRSLEIRSTAAKSPTPSPVTPLVSDPVFSPPAIMKEEEEEEKVIKEKGFYLYPSPRGSGPRELLSLFPLCSPKQQQQTDESLRERRS